MPCPPARSQGTGALDIRSPESTPLARALPGLGAVRGGLLKFGAAAARSRPACGPRRRGGSSAVAVRIGLGDGEEGVVLLRVADRDAGALAGERPDTDALSLAGGGEVLRP